MTDTDQPDTPPVEMYRVRTGVAFSSSASSGSVDYYESREAMLTALLAAQLDLLLKDDSRTDRNVARRRRLWRDFLKGDDYPKVTNVFGVHQLVEGQWLPLELTFTEPTVTADLA